MRRAPLGHRRPIGSNVPWKARRTRSEGEWRRAVRRESPRDVRLVRSVIGVLALLLGAYCFLAAATSLYTETAPGRPTRTTLAAGAPFPRGEISLGLRRPGAAEAA
jgi:hypothetical protein